MKIRHFSATKVHGHYNFEFKFNQEITFLVGINGSGKTSALRLMQAALSMDFATLFSIRFSNIDIGVEVNGLDYNLKIENTEGNLLVSINDEVMDIKVPLLADDERDVYIKNGRFDEHMEEQRLRFIKFAGSSMQKLIAGPRPLFLGLERKMGRYDEDQYQYDEGMWPGGYRGHVRARRDSIEGLENCQRLIERAYKNFRRISDSSSSRLINIIVESTFDYMEFDPESWEKESRDYYQEFENLLNRRREIEKFATDLGGGEKAAKQIGNFFSKINDIVNGPIKNNRNALSVEWLLNKAQIQRIHKILAEMDKQKKSAEKAYAPIKAFVDTMNGFLKDSRKNVEIDSVGRLKIVQAGSPILLHSLASGEKQLLILLTHARFANSKGGVFIVDEPEISLHLRWQEMLVDSLIQGNAQNQFIFATHSPEIVGFRKNHCIQVG